MGPLVSICLITYNHERYLRDALEGILVQNTSFDFEVVIGEDHSTDATRAVVDEYVERYPLLIRRLYREENLGLKRNFVDTLGHCFGDYIAVLSGDDYWTDPNKLERQAGFLTENQDYVLIGNNATLSVEGSSGPAGPVHQVMTGFDFTTADLIERNPCVASQVMFRNHVVEDFPEIYFHSTGEDRQLYLLLSEHGRCRFDPKVTGVYRVHPDSITQTRAQTYLGLTDARREQIRNATMWDQYYGGAFEDEVRRVRHRASLSLLRLALAQRDIQTSAEALVGIDPRELERPLHRGVVRIAAPAARLIAHRNPTSFLWRG